jgi:hypothetical protein
LLSFLTSYGRNELAKYCAASPQNHRDAWLQNFECGVKATDVLSAVFSFWLVIANGALVYVGCQQQRISRRQASIEESIKRPHLHVDPPTGCIFEPGSRAFSPCIEYSFLNHGSVPAHVKEEYTQIIISNELPKVPPCEANMIKYGHSIVGPPAHSPPFPHTDQRLRIREADFNAIASGKLKFFFFGFAKDLYSHGFCFELMPGQARGVLQWFAVGGDAYWYDRKLPERS